MIDFGVLLAKRFKDVNQHRTMLFGLPGDRPADTAQMVYGEVIGTVVHHKPNKPTALRGLYDWLVQPPS